MSDSDWDLVEGVVFRALTYSDDIVDDRAVPFADLSMRDRALAALRSERSASVAVNSAPSDEVDVRLQNAGRETDAACDADRHQYCASPASCACECHAVTPKPAVCVWKYDPDGYWQTQCGDQFCFSEGGPTENRVKFRHFCGKLMFESIYANEPDAYAGELDNE